MLLLLPALICAAGLGVSGLGVQGLGVQRLAAQTKAQKAAAPYAIVAGTVFRDPGFAQPGASVVLALQNAPTKKLQEQVSSPRGEFSFRIPPGPNTYVVTATLKGFQTASSVIEIQGEEQSNATLLLVPESKEKKR